MLTIDQVPALIRKMQGVVIHGCQLSNELAQFHSGWLDASPEEKQKMQDATESVATIFDAACQLNGAGATGQQKATALIEGYEGWLNEIDSARGEEILG